MPSVLDESGRCRRGPITEEKKEEIFDLFENLKTKRVDNTSIGLATVKKVVTETNGRIWVEPSEHQGARFVFTINKQIQTTANKNMNEARLVSSVRS